MDQYLSSNVGSSSGYSEESQPKLFINWAPVQQLLQSQTDGTIIQYTLLLKLDGSLLTSSYQTPASKSSASSSSSSSSSSPVQPKILGALVANIWKSAEQNGVNFLQSQQMNMMMLECEGGMVAVSRLSRFLLCIYATNSIEAGLLKSKMNELIHHLQPLNKVYG